MAPHPIWPGGPGDVDDLLAIAAIAGPILLLWFVTVALTGWLARRKDRDDGFWATLALFTGPIAMLAILLAPRAKPRVGPWRPGDPIPDASTDQARRPQ